jgi:hypothetical protein
VIFLSQFISIEGIYGLKACLYHNITCDSYPKLVNHIDTLSLSQVIRSNTRGRHCQTL